MTWPDVRCTRRRWESPKAVRLAGAASIAWLATSHHQRVSAFHSGLVLRCPSGRDTLTYLTAVALHDLQKGQGQGQDLVGHDLTGVGAEVGKYAVHTKLHHAPSKNFNLAPRTAWQPRSIVQDCMIGCNPRRDELMQPFYYDPFAEWGEVNCMLGLSKKEKKNKEASVVSPCTNGPPRYDRLVSGGLAPVDRCRCFASLAQ